MYHERITWLLFRALELLIVAGLVIGVISLWLYFGVGERQQQYLGWLGVATGPVPAYICLRFVHRAARGDLGWERVFTVFLALMVLALTVTVAMSGSRTLNALERLTAEGSSATESTG